VNCLVTGGAGFIGSHLVDVLVAEGNNVVVIDSLISGKKSNLVDVWDKIEFVQVDITRDDISDFFVGCDVVFHLAALADIVPSIVDPVGYVTTNVLGTLRVLEAVRKHNVPRVVYAASSSCYGLADEVPTKETSPIQPTYPYALSKWMGEELVMHWGELYKIDVLSLRLFNVYGPRARTSGNYGAVLGVFFAQHLAELPLTVVGDGTQTRDFIYVQDVVEAFVAASKCKANGVSINIGASNPVSVNEVARMIGGQIVNIPRRPGEPDTTHADISLAKRYLDWTPTTTFKEGMKLTIDQIQLWKDAPIWSAETIAIATEDWFKFLGTDKELDKSVD
jgi:UDP-glucose 4-epimerase